MTKLIVKPGAHETRATLVFDGSVGGFADHARVIRGLAELHGVSEIHIDARGIGASFVDYFRGYAEDLGVEIHAHMDGKEIR